MPNSKNNKRPASPQKAAAQDTSKKVAKSPAKALSFNSDSEKEMDQSTSGSGQDGSAHGAVLFTEMSTPPLWFREFEARQEERFTKVIRDNQELFDGLKMDMNSRLVEIGESVNSLKDKLKAAEQKIDDLENRSRRCNLVIFNVPEKAEGQNCTKFVCDLIKQSGVTTINEMHSIQRAHRTGKINLSGNDHDGTSKPRPIHIGFTFFQEKELCRRMLAELFKQQKIGNAKLFVANDYSAKVQQMRREKLPELRKLRAEGKAAFLVYPAVIKVKDSHGNIRSL